MCASSNTGDASDAVVLAHISDIHFRKKLPGSDLYGPDDDLRHEMKRDLGSMTNRLGALHGILVTGDVAFAGDSEDYKRADTWLRETSEATGCPEQQIRVISGNHDVKRGAIEKSIYLRKAHESLRKLATAEKWAELDSEIEIYLNDPAIPELLYSPLDEYNKFATKFLSNFSRKQPYWTWDILLNDRSTLRIRGLNSALISSKSDNLGDNKLVLGQLFTALKREDGVEHMILCHHPPQWIWDQDPVEGYFNTRARIQLFGHKHVQKISEQTHGGFTSLKVHAGALNPDPGQAAYLPRYNCIQLRILNEGKKRKLGITIHSRAWDAEQTKFDDAANACHKCTIELESWNPAPVEAEALLADLSTSDPLKTVSDPLNIVANDPTKSRALSAPRRLAYRFLALSYPHQQEIATSLNLLEESDKGLPDIELFQRVFRRAAERSQLAEMWKRVESLHGESKDTINPFS
jgi:GTPase-associated adaptor domain/Calcineurin-like phosphoesterase